MGLSIPQVARFPAPPWLGPGATIRLVSPSRTTFPDPQTYADTPVYELLCAAANGHAGIDLRLIRSILARGEAAVADLLRFGLEDRSGDRVDLEEDLIAMLRTLKPPQALDYYLKCIRMEPRDVPDDLVQSVLPFGETAVGPLIALYRDLDEEDSSDVAFLLANLGVRDPRILETLLERLDYDADDGAFCLGQYGDPAAKPALEKLLSELSEEESELSREIRFAIGQLEGGREHEPVDSEVPDIDDMYPDEAPPPFEVLTDAEVLEMLASDAPGNRLAAAECFRNREVTAQAHGLLFDRAKSDPVATVRGACWEALADSEDKTVRAAMKQVVGDAAADVEERCGALVGLCNATNEPAVSKRMREFYADPSTRAKAMEAMWRSFDRQFSDFFPKHLDDADPEVRRQAVWGTGYMGLGSEAVRLKQKFDDEDLRSDALFAYSLCVPAEISRGRIVGVFRKIEKAAGELTPGEAELVKIALDQRLAMHGLDPVFAEEDDGEEMEEEESAPPPEKPATPGRNDPCPCGSGKKYKKCHGA